MYSGTSFDPYPNGSTNHVCLLHRTRNRSIVGGGYRNEVKNPFLANRFIHETHVNHSISSCSWVLYCHPFPTSICIGTSFCSNFILFIRSSRNSIVYCSMCSHAISSWSISCSTSLDLHGPAPRHSECKSMDFAPSFSVFNGIMSSPFMFQWKLPSQGSLIPRDWIKRNLHSSPLQRIHFCWSLV